MVSQGVVDSLDVRVRVGMEAALDLLQHLFGHAWARESVSLGHLESTLAHRIQSCNGPGDAIGRDVRQKPNATSMADIGIVAQVGRGVETPMVSP